MDIAGAITTQINILVIAVYWFIGLIVIGLVIIFGSMYLYGEYKEYQRKKLTRRDWL
jgi:hypothetical protein